jgi:hypothetical protein
VGNSAGDEGGAWEVCCGGDFGGRPDSSRRFGWCVWFSEKVAGKSSYCGGSGGLERKVGKPELKRFAEKISHRKTVGRPGIHGVGLSLSRL